MRSCQSSMYYPSRTVMPCTRRPGSKCKEEANVVYYESIKQDLKIKPIYECRCDERLQTKTKRFTLLSYTWVFILFYTSHIHWVVSFLLSYILRDVSFAEVGRVCRVALREPMHLCTCVSEEGNDGKAACSETPSLCTCVSEEGNDGKAVCSETPSLLPYTLRCVSFAEVGVHA